MNSDCFQLCLFFAGNSVGERRPEVEARSHLDVSSVTQYRGQSDSDESNCGCVTQIGKVLPVPSFTKTTPIQFRIKKLSCSFAGFKHKFNGIFIKSILEAAQNSCMTVSILINACCALVRFEYPDKAKPRER